MPIYRVAVVDKQNTKSKMMYELIATVWMRDTKNNPHAAAYKENISGAVQDISATRISRFTNYVVVKDDAGSPCVICKANITGARPMAPATGIDLSEIVKHPSFGSYGMWVLFKWALERVGGNRDMVTLTAAYKKLLEVYGRYGFAPIAPGNFSNVPDTTRINVAMKLNEVPNELLEAQYTSETL